MQERRVELGLIKIHTTKNPSFWRFGMLQHDLSVWHFWGAIIFLLNLQLSMSGQIFWLKRLCRSALAENGNMEEHIKEFLEIHHQLIDMGETLKDNLSASMLLASDPDSYSFFIPAIEVGPSKNELPAEFGKNQLIEKYGRRERKIGTRAKVNLQWKLLQLTVQMMRSIFSAKRWPFKKWLHLKVWRLEEEKKCWNSK